MKLRWTINQTGGLGFYGDSVVGTRPKIYVDPWSNHSAKATGHHTISRSPLSEPWLLKETLPSMLRQWKGHQFLESAYTGLQKLSNPKNQKLITVLHQIVQNPEIAEDWD